MGEGVEALVEQQGGRRRAQLGQPALAADVHAAPPPTRRPTTPRTNRDWAQQLANLADDLDRGRIYDREVEAMMPAMTALVAAFNRRYR